MSSNSTERLRKRFKEAQAQLVIQTADLPLGTLADMVEGRSIDLEPSFQRRDRWGVEKQSALIESFLLNVPVPPVYLAEEQSGTYTAIDGKQRLAAITHFIKGGLRLKSLERLFEAEGINFESLPEDIRNSLRLRPYIRVVTLLRQSQSDLKYEVFIRLNRGGESLNQQEIRNVAFRGLMNDAIYESAKSLFLRRQLKIRDDKSVAYRNMTDAEMVLRFLALNEKRGKYSGNLSNDMDRYMSRHQNADKLHAEEQVRSFTRALSWCESIWMDFAFKRPEKDSWRDQLLAGMYDAQMLAVATIPDEILQVNLKRNSETIAHTRHLFDHREFEEAVRAGTNTPQRIAFRVDAVQKMLGAVAGVEGQIRLL